MINPDVVEGQIAGGVVQGIGGVLYEHMVYDDDGNPLSTTFVDYLCRPRPRCRSSSTATSRRRRRTNPGGYKGMGEGDHPPHRPTQSHDDEGDTPQGRNVQTCLK